MCRGFVSQGTGAGGFGQPEVPCGTRALVFVFPISSNVDAHELLLFPAWIAPFPASPALAFVFSLDLQGAFLSLSVGRDPGRAPLWIPAQRKGAV